VRVHQKTWVRRCFGSTYDIIKTLKLQYLNGTCYEVVGPTLERKKASSSTRNSFFLLWGFGSY